MESEPPKADPPKRKRRWFQYSLRSLLIAMLLIGIYLRWTVVKVERQREAVKAILQDGGSVTYDYQIDPSSGVVVADAIPPGPKWLRKLLNDDFFINVVVAGTRSDAGMAHLDGLPQLREFAPAYSGWQDFFSPPRAITDAGLANVHGLARLEKLCLANTMISDGGLRHLNGLNQLKSLDLSRTRVSGSGFAQMNCPNLESLDLHDSPIKDAGLEQLKGFNRLAYLNLFGTSVTDLGVQELRKLPWLSHLDLSADNVHGETLDRLKDLPLSILDLRSIHVTDAALARIGLLRKLESLDLSGTKVTDLGLKHLKDLTAIKGLRLSGCQVTDLGLQEVKGLGQLEYLDLRDTKITDAAFDSLKKLTNRRTLILPASTWLPPHDLTITIGVRPGRVTASGVARIQNVLPNCAVYY